MFRKIFYTDYIYCKQQKERHSDTWECVGGFDGYMEADDYSAKENPDGETRLMHVPNILPEVAKKALLKHQLKNRTLLFYKNKD